MSAEDLRARLRRHLRTEEGEPAAPAAGLWREVLARRRARLAPQEAGPGPPADLAHEDGVLARRTRLARAHRHGDFALEEACGEGAEALALAGKDPALAGLDLGRALYLDTETSGLAGGAGTYVFLVGLGRFDEGGFELWQGFLPGPAQERELLAEVAARVRAADAVVSFFGKSFDRHRLEDKMRLHGLEPPFASVPHLDLYYPLRRLYAGSLPDGRLRTLEAELAGVAREDDLPGSQAPAAWFDFLHGRAHRLEGVFRHNRDDVLSLVVLAAHLARTLEGCRRDGTTLAGCAATRARGLARLRERRGEPDTSR